VGEDAAVDRAAIVVVDGVKGRAGFDEQSQACGGSVRVLQLRGAMKRAVAEVIGYVQPGVKL
jgi:hypothetical protein